MAKSRRKVRALIFAFKGISKNIYDLKRSVDYLSSKHSFTNGNIFSYPRIIHKYIFPFYCFDFVFAAYFLFLFHIFIFLNAQKSNLTGRSGFQKHKLHIYR